MLGITKTMHHAVSQLTRGDMSLQQIPGTCTRNIFLACKYWDVVPTTCPGYTSLLNIPATHPCYTSLLYVPATHPYYMSPLHAPATHPCYMSPAAQSCYTPLLHIPCYTSPATHPLLHIPCYTSLLHVPATHPCSVHVASVCTTHVFVDAACPASNMYPRVWPLL